MKGIVLSLCMLFSISVFCQTVAIKPIPATLTVDTVSLKKAKEMKLDTMTPVELAIKVVKQDSVLKDQQDTITKKESVINDIKGSASKYLWGGKPVDYFFWALFTVFLGMIASWSLLASIGMKKNPNTPNTWSWKEFFNPYNVIKRVGRFVFAVVGSFALIRYVLPDEFGIEATMGICFFIGFNWDYWVEYFRKRKESPKVPMTNTTPTTPAQ